MRGLEGRGEGIALWMGVGRARGRSVRVCLFVCVCVCVCVVCLTRPVPPCSPLPPPLASQTSVPAQYSLDGLRGVDAEKAVIIAAVEACIGAGPLFRDAPRGVLVHGPSGTGKTSLAYAVGARRSEERAYPPHSLLSCAPTHFSAVPPLSCQPCPDSLLSCAPTQCVACLCTVGSCCALGALCWAGGQLLQGPSRHVRGQLPGRH